VDASTWDCLSCGARAQHKPFCEQCGAAQPVEGAEDSALSMMLGLVCERCDGYNDPGVAVCGSCGAPLGDAPALDAPPAPSPQLSPEPAPEPAPAAPAPEAAATRSAPEEGSGPGPPSPPWLTPPTGNPLSTAFAMPKADLAAVVAGAEGAGLAAPQDRPAAAPRTGGAVPCARSPAPPAPPAVVPCARCATPLAPGDKFCRNCGARALEEQPLATAQIAAVKLPAPGLPSPVLGSVSTMIMPAARVGPSFAQGGAGAAPSGAAPPMTTLFFGAVQTERSAKLVLVRGQNQVGSQWRLQAGDTFIGRSDGAVLFPDDDAIAPRHCRLSFRGPELWLEPEETTNGVFLRVRERARLAVGDEIVIGAQRLRVLASEDRPQLLRSDDSTRVLGSMVKSSPPIALLRVAPNPAENEVFFRCQRLLTLGRNNCDVNFPRDSFVSERHAQISTEETGLLLEDLRSRNGTYLRVRQATQLQHGDLVLLGDKVLRVEIPR
jgi:pSer/pThr/pTyr-binding forkhead associated (FHA) protein